MGQHKEIYTGTSLAISPFRLTRAPYPAGINRQVDLLLVACLPAEGLNYLVFKIFSPV